MYPGLYDLAPGLRYADAIRKAGGMTDEADENAGQPSEKNQGWLSSERAAA